MAGTHYTRTWNSRTVHVIEANLSDISVASISGSVPDSGFYGVNGTFFHPTTGDLLGIAMNKDGAAATAVGQGGTGTQTANPCQKETQRGAMFSFYPPNPITSKSVDTAVVKNWDDYPGATTSNLQWAIGGYSLQHFGQSLTDTQYYESINGIGDPSKCTEAEHDTENAFRLEPTALRPRTAIGYKGGTGLKIILAVFQSEKAYEVRKFMMNDQNCTMAIMLDGGGSSQMSWPGGEYDPSDLNRSVYNMVRVAF